MPCEMCGRDDQLIKTLVEGSLLNVCKQCAQHGQIIEAPKIEVTINRPYHSPTHIEELEEDIIPNYSALIKQAREQKNLTQEEVAKDMAEKESVIHKLETGNMKPSVKLARKLEQYFRISLTEKEEEKLPPKPKKLDFKDSSLTIGDLINIDDDN